MNTHPAIRIILLLALAGLVLRLVAVDHGLPDVNEEATPVRQAWEMWEWQTGSIDPNPRFFNYPALTFYVHWTAQAAYRLVSEPTGLRTWGPSDDLPIDLVLLGRLLSILFTIILAAVTYRLGRRLMPTVWAAWAAVIVFWMPTLFHYSLLSIVDIPLAILSVLVIDHLTALDPDRPSHHLLAGFLIGLAASCKYTGVVLAVPYVVALFASRGWNIRTSLLRSHPWLAGFTTIVTFFAINPFVILDYDTFYWHYAFERHHMAVGHFGRLNSPLIEYGWTLWLNLGPLLIAAALPGAAFIGRRLDRRWTPGIAFAAFYPCFLVVWATSFGHYLFPVLPILVLLAVQGLRIGLVSLRRRMPVRIGRLALPLLAILPLSVSTVAEFTHMRTPTARALARQWIAENVSPGTIIATEPGGPEIDASVHDILLPLHTTNPEQATPVYHPGWYAPVDMAMVVESVESRYRSQADRFPDQIGLYRHLDAEWELAARLGREGEGIRIYRNPDPDRSQTESYPIELYTRLSSMSRVLAGRFLDRLGSAYRDAGRLTLSSDVYRRLTTAMPENQEYTLAYTDVLLSQGRRDLAIQLLESRRATGDDHLVASLHFLKAEYDSATAAWTRFAEAYPGNVGVRINLARILTIMGRDDEALRWYLEAIELNIDDQDAYVRASDLLIKNGDTTRARQIAARGLERWPQNEHLRQRSGE